MAIQIAQLHPHFGAELCGIDLAAGVGPELFAEIEAAFERYAVLVFPAQRLDDERQLAFSRLFGPLEVNPN